MLHEQMSRMPLFILYLYSSLHSVTYYFFRLPNLFALLHSEYIPIKFICNVNIDLLHNQIMLMSECENKISDPLFTTPFILFKPNSFVSCELHELGEFALFNLLLRTI